MNILKRSRNVINLSRNIINGIAWWEINVVFEKPKFLRDGRMSTTTEEEKEGAKGMND
jgi:hypothetical protein